MPFKNITSTSLNQLDGMTALLPLSVNSTKACVISLPGEELINIQHAYDCMACYYLIILSISVNKACTMYVVAANTKDFGSKALVGISCSSTSDMQIFSLLHNKPLKLRPITIDY